MAIPVTDGMSFAPIGMKFKMRGIRLEMQNNVWPRRHFAEVGLLLLQIIDEIRTYRSESMDEMTSLAPDVRGNDNLLQLVSFKIGDEEFGVDILKVQEINRVMDITRVPNAPPFVDGVINLRGKVVPIINVRRRFGMPSIERDKNTRVIVVELRGKTVGFLVDAVSEVLRIPRSVTEPPPGIVAGVGADYITAVGKLEERLLILLDLEKVLSHNETVELEPLAN